MPSLLSFHHSIIREVAPPETDDLVILAKGLGLRSLVCTLLKIYDGERNLVLLVRFLCALANCYGCKAESGTVQVNASPDEETGIGELLGTMGVRRPGMRVVSFEMNAKERCVSSPLSVQLSRGAPS